MRNSASLSDATGATAVADEGGVAVAEPAATKPYALYLGCTIPQRATNYEMSARIVAQELGMKLIDVGDMVCCGYPLASVDDVTPLTMAARILAQAESAGADLCCLCSACAGTLTEAAHELEHNAGLRAQVDANLEAIGLRYSGGVKVRHFVRILVEEVGLEAIAAKLTRPLPMKVATHYGCHFLRPSKVIGFDSVEDPQTIDEILRLAGCEPVDYPEKLKCCGGGVLAVDEKLALTVASRKLDRVKERGADAICLVCPFCNIMYDINQKKIEQELAKQYQIPVLFLTQILGLAMGHSPKDLGMSMNRVRTKDLQAKLGIAG